MKSNRSHQSSVGSQESGVGGRQSSALATSPAERLRGAGSPRARSRKRERGIALIITLGVLVVILLIAIGFVQLMGFVAFSMIGNQRWQVNILLSVLYVVGIGLAGYALFIQ